jgi:hypothetical protein
VEVVLKVADQVRTSVAVVDADDLADSDGLAVCVEETVVDVVILIVGFVERVGVL